MLNAQWFSLAVMPFSLYDVCEPFPFQRWEGGKRSFPFDGDLNASPWQPRASWHRCFVRACDPRTFACQISEWLVLFIFAGIFHCIWRFHLDFDAQSR